MNRIALFFLIQKNCIYIKRGGKECETYVSILLTSSILFSTSCSVLARVAIFPVLLSLVRYRLRSLSEYMFPAAFKNAVVYQVKLNSCSLPINYEENVVTFNNLVVPANDSIPCLY